MVTYPGAVIRFHASDMALHIDADAAYLVLPKVKGRIDVFNHLSTCPPPLSAIP